MNEDDEGDPGVDNGVDNEGDSESDPGVIITLGPPAVIHQVLGQLPAVLVIPPEINPPPSVPLQQGKTSSMFRR